MPTMTRAVDLTNPIFTDPEAARKHFEAIRWPNGPYCPFCGVTDRVAQLGGKSMGPGWYHCRDCRRKFTAQVGTVYERSHIPMTKWLLATNLMCASKKGISAHQLHRMLGLPYKTAWFMARRIREAMRDGALSPLGGTGKFVEVDETYIGRVRGMRKSRGPSHKMKVLSLVERGGNVRSIRVESVSRPVVEAIVKANVDHESRLTTDEAPYYPRIGRHFAGHESVNHSADEWARGDAHTNTLEGFFSIFKRGMRGVYQHCGEQHLHRYLAEFDFRYNKRSALNVTEAERAIKAIKGWLANDSPIQQPDHREA
jgi:transposase-like protein